MEEQLKIIKKPLVYLASPLGFSDTAKRYVLPQIIQQLEKCNVEVYEPFSRNEQNGLGPSSGKDLWALDIAYADVNGVKNADAIFAVINGTPPDEGVAVELGVAIALNKPTFLFRDDFRKCADSNTFPCNLMLYAGLPREGFEKYIYNSIDEIIDSEKALCIWAAAQKLKGNNSQQRNNNINGKTNL